MHWYRLSSDSPSLEVTVQCVQHLACPVSVFTGSLGRFVRRMRSPQVTPLARAVRVLALGLWLSVAREKWLIGSISCCSDSGRNAGIYLQMLFSTGCNDAAAATGPATGMHCRLATKEKSPANGSCGFLDSLSPSSSEAAELYKSVYLSTQISFSRDC